MKNTPVDNINNKILNTSLLTTHHSLIITSIYHITCGCRQAQGLNSFRGWGAPRCKACKCTQTHVSQQKKYLSPWCIWHGSRQLLRIYDAALISERQPNSCHLPSVKKYWCSADRYRINLEGGNKASMPACSILARKTCQSHWLVRWQINGSSLIERQLRRIGR